MPIPFVQTPFGSFAARGEPRPRALRASLRGVSAGGAARTRLGSGLLMACLPSLRLEQSLAGSASGPWVITLHRTPRFLEFLGRA